jgi:hypothetical protein
MTTTLAPPPSSKQSVPCEPPLWPTPALDRGSELVARAYVEPRRRFWILDGRRREEVFASDFALLASIAFMIPLAGVIAYFYALWAIGPC